MSEQKYWRVILKRGQKVHLTGWIGDGSGDLALCGKPLPFDQRRGSSGTVAEPRGDECIECQIASGRMKRKSPPKPSEEALRMRRYYQNLLSAHENLQRMGLSASDAAAVLQNLLTAKE
jgi:hypothetical protein